MSARAGRSPTTLAPHRPAVRSGRSAPRGRSPSLITRLTAARDDASPACDPETRYSVQGSANDDSEARGGKGSLERYGSGGNPLWPLSS